MNESLHVASICEVWTDDGPTGEVAEVLKGELRDNGNNVLFKGTASECEREQIRYLGMSVALWPTMVQKLPEGSTGERSWNLWVEPHASDFVLSTPRPITSESYRGVVHLATGIEGVRAVRWTEFHSPELFGPVLKYHPSALREGEENPIIAR